MQRVMIIGQPGSGKSVLARKLGAITYLPVYHIDHIHWKSGWVERDGAEKDRLCREVHARAKWIFEGGRSATWNERLARADTLIWLDLPPGLRCRRILWRSLRYRGRTRPDLPAGCPERISVEFLRWVWDTRHSARLRMREFFDSVPEGKTVVHLTRPREVAAYLDGLRKAVAIGNLGIPHR